MTTMSVDELEQLLGERDDESRRRRLLRRSARSALRLYVRARDARLHLTAPAVACAGLISAGVALRFGVWAGLIAAGVFCGRFDSRIR